MHVSCDRVSKTFAARRCAIYLATCIVLVAVGLFLRRSAWVGTAQLHTMMEIMATVLAMLVGVLGLFRFYRQKENIFLFIGTGFIGASLLDGYHAFVSSSAFSQYFPSPPPSLIPWSGLASRVFLSVLFWLSWLFWRRESRLGPSARVPEYRVYFVVNTWTLACCLFFAVMPLPVGYWHLPVFHRPQEFVPTFFCLMALTGYLRKGGWKHDPFEHCLVLSIILFVIHLIYMSWSGRLFDAPYISSHLLRLGSYICTLFGLIITMSRLAHNHAMPAAPTEGVASRVAATRTVQSIS